MVSAYENRPLWTEQANPPTVAGIPQPPWQQIAGVPYPVQAHTGGSCRQSSPAGLNVPPQSTHWAISTANRILTWLFSSGSVRPTGDRVAARIGRSPDGRSSR